MGKISARKLDHLVLTAFYDVESSATTLLEDVVIVNNALPELSLDRVDTSVRLFGKRLSAPIIVSGMTGGHEVALHVNRAIARAVEELGLGMGVGSQRAALRDPSLVETYRVARKEAPSAVIIANIGAAQLPRLSREDVEKLIEMIEADALAVHINAPQEVFQPEGDTNFHGVYAALARLLEWVDVPVLVKETGHSIDPFTVSRLRALGIEYFDVSGVGGTSWIRVEEYRARQAGDAILASEARVFRDWGLPTAVAVAAARWYAPDACILAGGGVWTGLDVAKAIALGADAATLALPVLRAYVSGGVNGVKRLLARVVDELRKTLYLTGSKSLGELASTRIIVKTRLAQMLSQLGVDVRLYESTRRARLYASRPCSL